ncbi:FKBP-type peptidyl-prolyl cis-trans isomerase [Candidatus Nomurabacteria bacterium]|nr:FKBP-type peptidyl-prolyl cis-trans isomerase [Candidatus Nomurabacteria bacterium]
MFKDNKLNMVVSVLIILVVIGGLAYITINKNKNKMTAENNTQTVQKEGYKFTITKEGNGDIAKTGDTVAMNYTGMLADGTVFDSNVDPKFNHVQPFVFTIGAGQVIKGWDEGIAGMKTGEQRTLEINPEYGYGANGVGGVIPPNSVLTFKVELVAIKK